MWIDDAWFTLGVLGLIFAMLVWGRVAPDVVLIGGVVLLLLKGILEPREALAGLANEGMASIGALYIVGAGMHRRAEWTGLRTICSAVLNRRPGPWPG